MRFSSAQKLVQFLLDLVAPPSERTKQVRSISADEITTAQNREIPKKDFVEAVCDYRQQQIRDIVQAAKYDGSRHAIHLMSEILAKEILAICEKRRIICEKIVITHIPMRKEKQNQRGFNQSKRIAATVAKLEETGSCTHRNLLKKNRKTKAQTHLSKPQRRQNLKNAFSLKEKDISGTVIFVIDDVATTGATLAEARRALAVGNPEKVIGLAFAH